MARAHLFLAPLVASWLLLGLAETAAAQPSKCREITGTSSHYRWCENRFTAMPAAERAALVHGTPPVAPTGPVPPPPGPSGTRAPAGDPAAATFSWHDLNGDDWMTGVRDQGNCGACFVFASTGVTESMYKWLAADPTIDINLSEQSLISCITLGSCDSGGTAQEVGMRLKSDGAPDEACYPYTQTDGDCAAQCADWQARAGKISDWHSSVIPWSDDDLKAQLVYGPVVANMQVYDDFYGYSGGVYSRDPDAAASGWHAVAVVGWDDGDNSWIVRNSWTEDWGDHGYFKMSRVSDCLAFISGVCFATNVAYFDVETPNVPGIPCLAEQDLALTAVEGESANADVNVTNCGGGFAITLAGAVIPDAPWLTWHAANEQLDVGAASAVNVLADAATLTAGVYETDLRLSGGPGSDVVHVTFTVNPAPINPPDGGGGAGNGPAAGGAGGVPPEPAATHHSPVQDEGCGCRVAGASAEQTAQLRWVGLGGLALVLVARSRRRRRAA